MGISRCAPGGDTTDTDGDALLDCWERDGIDFDGRAGVDLVLYDIDGDGTIEPSERADPNVKDIYVEVDWMQAPVPGVPSHQPIQTALDHVIAAFRDAPVDCPPPTDPGGPVLCRGIRLHIQVDDGIPHTNDLAFQPCTATSPLAFDFDTPKSLNFGTVGERRHPNRGNILNAKRFAFRYALFVHELVGKRASGCAEFPGNDFVVALGGFMAVGGHATGDENQQSGVFMHELGHNLYLHHGGGDLIACKPNYLSVMNSTRIFAGVPVVNRPLNYSGAALRPLREDSLRERRGIARPFPLQCSQET